MVTVPGVIPVTTPVELTVAITVLLQLQVPPLMASDNGVVELTHTVDKPVIGAVDVVTTETVTEVLHPVPAVE